MNILRQILLSLMVMPVLTSPSHASLFQGEALDTMADIVSWVVLIIIPIAGIYVFWMLHIIPEKMAEKSQHPQKEAIHMLCILSLFFGGLLWPLAMLWAKTKPVGYKLAYGTDKHPDALAAEVARDSAEINTLKAELAELKSRVAAQTGTGAV